MPFYILRRLLRRHAQLPPEDAQARRAILMLSGYLAAIFALHIVAMIVFEDMSLGDAAWLTATTVTTVGYGDVSAETGPGRAATFLLLYVGGIFALAKGAGDYFEYRASRRQRMLTGQWRWHMEHHVLLVNAPDHGATPYFETLIRQFQATDWGRDRPVLILTEAWRDGLPQALHELGAAHVHGHGGQDGMLEAADARTAAAIVVLAEDQTDRSADSITFDIIHRARELNPGCALLAECVDDRNRGRVRRAGATAVVRPMRGYPEMMVRAIVAPGSEYIVEDLFTAHGDECIRYAVNIEGVAWGRLAAELIVTGVGTAIAFESADDGGIEINPRPDRVISARALHVIAKEGYIAGADEVCRIAEGAKAAQTA